MCACRNKLKLLKVLREQTHSLTGFMVAKYFSLRMASFSAPLRYCMAIVRFTSWSICINRLIKWKGGIEGGRKGGRKGGREGGREGGIAIIDANNIRHPGLHGAVTAKFQLLLNSSTYLRVGHKMTVVRKTCVLTSWTYSKG